MSNLPTTAIACKQCCDYPSANCNCPTGPTQPVGALAIPGNRSLVRQRGVLRVIASDAKAALNQLSFKAWYRGIGWVNRTTDFIFNKFSSLWKNPLYHLVDILTLLCALTLIGLPVRWWWAEDYWPGAPVPRKEFKAWESRVRKSIEYRLTDYIKSVIDRAREPY